MIKMAGQVSTNLEKEGIKVGYYVHSAIMVVIMFGIGMIPPIEPLTQLGMQVLGIFAGLLYGWSFVDLIWPSLLGMVALGLTDYGTMVSVFKEGFGDDIFVMVFFMFVYSSYLNRSGFTQFIADWFVSRKVAIGRPWVFSLMIFLTAYVIGASISLTATIIIVWNIFYGICDAVGYKPGDKYPVYMLVGVVVSAMLGYAIFPFKPVQALLLSGVENASGLTIDFFLFTMITFVITMFTLMGYLLLGKFVLKPDVSLLTSGKDHFAELRYNKMNTSQKIAASSMVIFLIMVLGPSIAPNMALMGFFKTLRITGSIVVILTFLVFIKGKTNTSIVNFNKCANDNISWDVLILFAATMPSSHALTSDKTGIMEMITKIMDPLFSGMSPIVFTIAFVVFAACLTQIVHNLVLAALIPPIMCQFAIPLGANPALIAVLVAFSLGLAIATPGASTPGALTYANRKWITAKQAYGYCGVSFVMLTFVVLIVGIPLIQFFV